LRTPEAGDAVFPDPQPAELRNNFALPRLLLLFKHLPFWFRGRIKSGSPRAGQNRPDNARQLPADLCGGEISAVDFPMPDNARHIWRCCRWQLA